MKLNEIKDNEGAHKRRMRVGRGIGSGKGKTAGRGYKGQKSRTGVRINGFEGGQMPIHRRLPKRGFNSLDPISYAEINVGAIQKAIDSGALDGKKAITHEALVDAGLTRNNVNGLKLLAKGAITAKISIEVTKASKAALVAVEKAGGSVKVAEEAAK